MATIIISLLLIFYLILAIYNLEWAILTLIFALPAYMVRFAVGGIPLTFLEGMIIIAFSTWFIREFWPVKFNFLKYIKQARNGQGRTDYPFKWEIIAFIVISWIALAVAHFNTAALGIWKAYFMEPLLVFILAINVLKKPGIKKVLWALTLSALAVSLFAAYQKITGQFIPNEFWAAAANRRVVSFFDFPNAVGLCLAPIVLLMSGLLVYVLKGTDKNKYLQAEVLAFTILLSVLAIIFAQSKGALVGVAAGIFLGGLIFNKRIRIITLAVSTVVLIGVITYQPAFKQISNLAQMKTLSGQIRQQQWIETKKMLAAGKWFWGAGLSGYQAAVAPFHQEGIFIKTDDPDWLNKIRTDENFRATHWQPTEIYMYPHNIFLNFWSELGLLGMILMVWIIIKYFAISTRIKSFLKKNNDNNYYLTIGFISAMAAIVVHGFVDVPYFKNDLSVMFWILMAVAGIFEIERRLEKK